MAKVLFAFKTFVTAATLVSVVLGVDPNSSDGHNDLCAKIASTNKWVAPSDVRACFDSYKLDENIRSNIIEVVTKTLPFHTSVNFQRQAPPPFEEIHEDITGDLERISKKKYDSEYDMYIELSRAFRRLNDGHAGWINYCYVCPLSFSISSLKNITFPQDGLYINYLPLPLSLITDSDGQQSIRIAFEAFDVASAEFSDQIEFWQNTLPGALKGKLSSLSGAKVLEINGNEPWDAVEAKVAISGGYQAHTTRQNAFFASYQRSTTGWIYRLGDFAQESLHTFTLPYRSRVGPTAVDFADTTTWRQNNCLAVKTTNGVDAYANTTTSRRTRQHIKNEIMDDTALVNVALPPTITPPNPLNTSQSVSQFYVLDDKKTGVLALGSFSDGTAGFDGQVATLLTGLQALKAAGVQQLIIDVTNNGGGYVCIAHFLHRIIAGPKPTTEPQAGLYTTARAGPLARLISQTIAEDKLDPDRLLFYNSLYWSYANNTSFPPNYDWVSPVVPKIINGHQDAFTQRLGSECPPSTFNITAPPQAIFDPKKVVIVSNGRCGSSCSLFSITMVKKEGAKTVVVGGKKGPQQYSGTVGGQSIDFATVDTEIKTAKLKNNTLSPPDLIVNAVNGITWRLGYGVWNPNEPEEWQSRPADFNLAVTADISNNPLKIWERVVKVAFN
ncbi:hypothetical protein CPB83DRAFT_911433 [Crepidotus variabilis]|uniref:Tail specific protease domain-containing protein n=1 Tax=Crepidotus variabilis TaxID=179855 RepID=A0A9P6E4I0_9AGAR|nr:hypothetical protein CPB83DRAFT_911433 [Crepidotus variabilis]